MTPLYLHVPPPNEVTWCRFHLATHQAAQMRCSGGRKHVCDSGPVNGPHTEVITRSGSSEVARKQHQAPLISDGSDAENKDSSLSALLDLTDCKSQYVSLFSPF